MKMTNKGINTEAGKANTKLVGGILLALALTGGAATMVSAQADTPSPSVPTTLSTDVNGGDIEEGLDHEGEGDIEGCDFNFEELSDEERAEIVADITAENDRIRAALDAAGIAYTLETDDELGVEFVVWDYEDEAANAVVDEIFTQVWAQEWAEIPQAERNEIIAEVTAENEALKTALDAAGIAYTEVQDEVMGVPIVEWDFEDEAAWDVVEDVYGELFDDGDFDDDDFEEFDLDEGVFDELAPETQEG